MSIAAHPKFRIEEPRFLPDNDAAVIIIALIHVEIHQSATARAREREGIDVAKKAGKHLGRRSDT